MEDVVPLIPAKSARIHYVDWLRVLIVYGIALYHISLVFSGTSWLVTNKQSSIILEAFAGFTFAWGIPAMFLIAGGDSWLAMRSRTPVKFLKERFFRLFVPMVVGIALLSPLQQYLFSHNPPPSISKLPGHYVSFFHSLRWEWPGPFLSAYSYHLWFLGYLFAISAVCLPVLLLMRTDTAKRWISALAQFSQHFGGLLIFVVPMAVTQMYLRPRFPSYRDWADIVDYILVFIYGAIILSDKRFEQAVRNSIWLALIGGVLGTAGVGGILGLHISYIPTAPLGWQLAYGMFWSINLWSWLIALLYLGMRWLNKPNKLITFANDDVMPFYVVHHPIVVGAASFIVVLDIGVWPKFAMMLCIVYALTIFICEFGIRRVRFMRFLFGLKVRRPHPVEPKVAK